MDSFKETVYKTMLLNGQAKQLLLSDNVTFDDKLSICYDTLNRKQLLEWCILVTEDVLPMCRDRNSNSKSKAIEAITAARKVLVEDTEENREKAKVAAKAAYTAAYVAYAADYAAYNAYAAAYAADYAAYAVAYAADAAAYTAAYTVANYLNSTSYWHIEAYSNSNLDVTVAEHKQLELMLQVIEKPSTRDITANNKKANK